MSRIRALIVEDESHCQEHLSHLLKAHESRIEVVGICNSISSALQDIELLKPALLFLDVNLGDGTGFDLLSESDNSTFQVIFTTSQHEHAVRAFQLNAIHYLIKPILRDELNDALSRLNDTTISLDQSVEAHLAAADSIKNKIEIPRTIRINSTQGFKVIQVEDIVHLKADEGCTRFHVNSEMKVHISSYTLKTYLFLDGDPRFFQSHKSHLINLLRVDRYDGKFAQMTDGSNVPVSERKKAAFKKAFELLH